MYILNISDFYTVLLTLLQVLIILSGIFIITNKNPVISILYLISLFLSVAIYLIILNIVFVGISYLLVYIGAVSILFLFILMLIDIRISELHEENNNNFYLGLIVSILFFVIFANHNINNNKININSDNTLSYIYDNNWENLVFENYDLVSLGNVLYSNYSILLIMALLILLLAMVGAIKINIK
jgi:NADH-ubiquinone oxidoreductase chain 6